ncbi:MAG TPA: BTAD domain-containing putative transcriptional regulator [Candidatus Dormibacteraeota bacterium]|nr:BTAD domain-containing putative transcriptional regulator [Candidatus Dormibacteraeota bacterium]
MGARAMEFRILGPLEVWEGGRSLPLGGAKQRALLAILLTQANQVVAADRLVDLIWPDGPPDTADHSLQVYVSQLRKVLEPEHKVGTPYTVLISQPPGYLVRITADDLDVGRFQRLMDEARQLLADRTPNVASTKFREALGLWRGPALADFASHAFALSEIGRLTEMRLCAIEDRIEADLALGRHTELAGELEGLVAKHPLRERLRGQMMLALYRSGRQAEASAVYQETRKLLVDQLGMEPGNDLQRLLKRILNQDPVLDVTARTPTIRRESMLPRFTNAFVGRLREIDRLAHRLETSSMVTLTGPGGMGKTRLAVELTAKLSARYSDGVVFVDLAPLIDESLIIRTIGRALGLRDDGVRNPMDVLVSYLNDRSLLLILDNCEHLLATAAAAATAMLSQCRGLTILATSREALGVPGETIWEVPSLPTHSHVSDRGRVDLDHGDAVELFRVRAEAAASRSFVWDGAAIVDATRICHRLDGSPLAIELVAARLRVMPLSDLLAGLDKGFALLTTGSRTATPRHHSLEATVDWSYQLLSSSEQLLFQRLAVFSGGFTPDAAEEVCADISLLPRDVMPTLFSLVEKSLIRLGATMRGGARYNMLQTIREYSLNKLQASSGAVDLHMRHALYFAAMASPTEATVRTRHQAEWLDQLEEEHDNFRTAIEWGLQTEPRLALEIATSLDEFWTRRHIAEGTTWVTRATEAAMTTGELQARATDVAGHLALLTGDQELAFALLGEAAKAWAELGDVSHAGRATDRLGSGLFASGAIELGLEQMNRAVEMLRPTRDQWRLASALNNLGFSLALIGDSLTAKPLLDEALQLARQCDDPHSVANILDSIAEVEMSLGRFNDARALWQECFAIAMRLDDKRQTAYVLERRARLALLEGDPELCIRLASVSEAVRSSTGEVAPQDWREIVIKTVEEARHQLPDLAAETAWREGKTMTVEEIMAFVVSP